MASLTTATVYRPTFPTFRDRVLYIRCVLLKVKLEEMAKLTGLKLSTMATWEKGVIPHDQEFVARAYADAAKTADPAITAAWVMFGDSPLYGDDARGIHTSPNHPTVKALSRKPSSEVERLAS